MDNNDDDVCVEQWKLDPRLEEMQPMLTRSHVLEDPDRSDPPDVFCSLGSLIVEGRVPANVDRGYGEGPHVPPSRTLPLARHACSEENSMVRLNTSLT